ncbi:hypothetical protein E3N88_16467 [Mikania micrantha]|uniref:Uncharacterized protein n=1 Tax=Mikania micrantha TaxID=192012 RepID=A0A5N6NZQ5_9ASTR|nr:hypothetical protein E3N88_16467 [Mikania micrantha]
MKPTGVAMKSGDSEIVSGKRGAANNKPQFRPAADDTKPLLQGPILRSDPIETEEAVLRLPPFPRPPALEQLVRLVFCDLEVMCSSRGKQPLLHSRGNRIQKIALRFLEMHVS